MSELFRDFLDRKFNEVIDAINQNIDELANGTITSISSNITATRPTAFSYCTELVDVNLPELLIVNSNAFQRSTSLQMLDFPKVYTIAVSAFSGCTALDTLVLRHNGVVTLYNLNTFNQTPFASGGSGGKLYVPQALITAYQSAPLWSDILSYPNNQILAIEGSPYEN